LCAHYAENIDIVPLATALETGRSQRRPVIGSVTAPMIASADVLKTMSGHVSVTDLVIAPGIGTVLAPESADATGLVTVTDPVIGVGAHRLVGVILHLAVGTPLHVVEGVALFQQCLGIANGSYVDIRLHI
jgi:hypothetical protein